MPTLEARDQFPLYLHESMSQGVLDDIKDAVKDVVNRLSFLSNRGGNDPKKELIFKQKQMLQVAEEYLQNKPWITYFASVKHLFFLKANGIDPSTFSDFRDKEYALEVQAFAERVALSAEEKLDEDTITFLQELIILQQIEPLIPESIRALTTLAATPLDERKRVISPENSKRSLAGKLFFPKPPSKNEWAIKMDRYFISKLADMLKQSVETWICSPNETIAYLEELQKRRPLLEDTYLQL